MDPRASRLAGRVPARQGTRRFTETRSGAPIRNALPTEGPADHQAARRQPPPPPPPSGAAAGATSVPGCGEAVYRPRTGARRSTRGPRVPDPRATRRVREVAEMPTSGNCEPSRPKLRGSAKAAAPVQGRRRPSRRTRSSAPRRPPAFRGQALHAIEEQSRGKDHEAKVKAEAEGGTTLQLRELEEAKASLVRARNKLKASNAQRGSTETRSRRWRRDVVAAAAETVAREVAAPSEEMRRRQVRRRRRPRSGGASTWARSRRAASTKTTRRRRRRLPAKRRGVDAGTQSPKPRTTSTGVQSPRPAAEPRRAESPRAGAPRAPALWSRRTRRSWPPSSPCRRRRRPNRRPRGRGHEGAARVEGAADGARERARDQ